MLIGARNAAATLRAGFTTVRDVGTFRAFLDCALRDAIDAGWVAGPRMQCAGAYVTAPEGGGELTGLPAGTERARELHASVSSVTRPRFGPPSGASSTAARPDQGHRHRRRADARHRCQRGRVPEPLIRVAVEEAAARGAFVAAHAHGDRGHQAGHPCRRPLDRARLAARRRGHRPHAQPWHVLGRRHLRRRLDRRAGSARGLAGRDDGQERGHQRRAASGLHARCRGGRADRVWHRLGRLPARPERPAVRATWSATA